MTSQTLLDNVRIILVEPAGALNVGAIARGMKNMGLKHLVLVKPRCDYLGEDARKMAVHGLDVLEATSVEESLAAALRGCHRAIATTARARSLSTLESPRDALPWLLTDNLHSALIFGPEDRGLSNLELNHAQKFVCIPTNSEYTSLNLAQAVTVCTYELFLAAQQLNNNFSPTSNITPCTMDALLGYYEHLKSVLLKIGYLYPHTATARLEKFKYLYNRANLTNQELAMLRGVLRQIDWVLTKRKDET